MSESEEISFDSESEVEDIPVGDPTKRLAIMGINWELFRAQDLWVILASFLPPTGVLLSIKIYPSNFGLEKMAEEERDGPPVFTKDEGEEVDLKLLRKYERAKRKYYFGVAVCDTIATANALYNALNQTQVEGSSVLDLRFIDDELEFEGRAIKSECNAPPSKYTPDSELFQHEVTTGGLEELDWDNNDRHRNLLTRKTFTQQEINENDWAAYLDSSDESEYDEQKAKNYRKLLLGDLSGSEEGDDQETKNDFERDFEGDDGGSSSEGEEIGDTEMTFDAGLAEKTAKLLKQREAGAAEGTVWDKYLEKRTEKKREQKQLRKQKQTGVTPMDTEDPEADPFADFDEAFKEHDKREKQKKTKRHNNKPQTEEDKKKAAELELIMFDPTKKKKVEQTEAVPMKKKARKKEEKAQEKQEEERLAEVVVKDTRFGNLLSDPKYALDPTRKASKTGPSNEKLAQLVREKKETQRSQKGNSNNKGAAQQPKKELDSSVKNLKAKFGQQEKKR